jgi:L-ascorbate metabolism protein UlaG (beta-lactamase superfamily)
MIGHATVLIQAAGRNFLVDPVWSERASPFRFAGPKRVNAPGVAFEQLPPIDVVLLTHNHYDHLDMSTMQRLWARDRPRIIAPLGNDAVVARSRPEIVVETRDWREEVEIGGGATVWLHPANHWSARGIADQRMALWCGYVIATPVGAAYVAGDTGYGDGRIFLEVADRRPWSMSPCCRSGPMRHAGSWRTSTSIPPRRCGSCRTAGRGRRSAFIGAPFR